jgi:hypothetical protein
MVKVGLAVKNPFQTLSTFWLIIEGSLLQRRIYRSINYIAN